MDRIREIRDRIRASLQTQGGKRRLVFAAAGAAALLLVILLLALASGKTEYAEVTRIDPSERVEYPYPTEVTILCTGDNLIHKQLWERARKDGTYDFLPLYAPVRDQVEAADIATVNQETPIASDLYPLSTYPKFNSPKQVGQALIDIGFDVINLGNNHMYDAGEKGAIVT